MIEKTASVIAFSAILSTMKRITLRTIVPIAEKIVSSPTHLKTTLW